MTEQRNNNVDTNSRAYKIAAGKGVMNLPNKLTIARMVMIPLFILFFYLGFSHRRQQGLPSLYKQQEYQ